MEKYPLNRTSNAAKCVFKDVKVELLKILWK